MKTIAYLNDNNYYTILKLPAIFSDLLEKRFLNNKKVFEIQEEIEIKPIDRRKQDRRRN